MDSLNFRGLHQRAGSCPLLGQEGHQSTACCMFPLTLPSPGSYLHTSAEDRPWEDSCIQPRDEAPWLRGADGSSTRIADLSPPYTQSQAQHSSRGQTSGEKGGGSDTQCSSLSHHQVTPVHPPSKSIKGQLHLRDRVSQAPAQAQGRGHKTKSSSCTGGTLANARY